MSGKIFGILIRKYAEIGKYRYIGVQKPSYLSILSKILFAVYRGKCLNLKFVEKYDKICEMSQGTLIE